MIFPSLLSTPLAMSLGTFPFPKVNASLNGASAVLLVIALIAIKSRKIRAHTYFILAAVATSTVFLACYITFHLYRHYHHIDLTRFPNGNSWKSLYLMILTTHTILAVVTVPLVIMTLLRAYRQQWVSHRKIAVWTFPIWLYVSVTGVIIYGMLTASGAYAAH